MPKLDIFEFEKSMIELIAEKLGVSSSMIKLQSNFKNDLGADSLDVLDLTIEIEDRFDIHIHDDDIAKCETVKQLLDVIKTKVENEK
jgi:acyl carrier protein